MSEQVMGEKSLASVCNCNPDVLSDLEDGFLRLRITHQCNCKCEFCYQNNWSEDVVNAYMDEKMLFEYCEPLYHKVKTLLVGGGELTVSKYGYDFCKFLGEKHPKVNVLTESNGILYDEKWQDLAVKHLFMQHFSLNAASGEIYEKAVWKEGGKPIFDKVLGNIKSLSRKWHEAGMPYFTPSVSMVVNHKSVSDMYDFIKLALELNLKATGFYFDHREGALSGDAFKYPEILEPALKMLMKIERVLAKKFLISFRLWLPLNSTEKLQAEVEKIPIEELRQEFSELLDLASARDPYKEWELRNKIRESVGKKILTFEEDYFPSLHNENKLLNDGTIKSTCFAPFKSFDIYSNGPIVLCGWTKRELNINQFIKDDKLDWSEVLNHPIFQDMRAKALSDDFSKCMDCCPLHPKNPHLNNFMEYGFRREKP